MEPLGVAVLGTGSVSGEHIKAFRDNPHTEVRAILSRDRARAEARAAQYNLANCRPYTDLEQLLRQEDVSIVSICTPHALHVEQGVCCAAAGRHLVVEKPVALDLPGLRRLTDAVERAGVRSVVSFVLRWNPLFETIRAMLAQGLAGSLFYAEVDYLHGIGRDYTGHAWITTREGGGSSLLSAGCHAVDGLRWFAGQEAVEVFAYSNTSRGNPAGYQYHPNTVTLVKFANGLMGKVASSIECQMPYLFNILLAGDRGTIRNNQVFSRQWPGQTGWATVPTILPDSGAVEHHPFQAQMDHLVDCIRSGRESHCNLADAARTHEICLAADRSAETGQPVKLPLEG
ncbi:MAG: Gfo/Idh/MocA family oxidoreductase [Bryobacterales bacterium]|nr:Gfo/Idh/MocA family oxidoreductase [Bryobacterales bacterium]